MYDQAHAYHLPYRESHHFLPNALRISNVEKVSVLPECPEETVSISALIRDNRSTTSRKILDALNSIVPFGGVLSSAFSLACMTLGGGIISMPASFKTTGIVMSMVYLLIVTVITIYTMVIMGYTMKKTGLKTYEDMARGLFGQGWDYFVGFILWFSCAGTIIAYVGATYSLLTPIFQNSSATPEYLKTASGLRLVTSLVCICLMFPLVLPKRVNSIRYVSVIGCSFVVFFVLSIVVHSSLNGLKLGMRGNMKLMTTGIQAVEGMNIFIFSYLCQAVGYSVYFEMRPTPSVRKLTWASILSVSICTSLYILAGFFGYMDFGDATEDSILFMFNPIKDPLMMISYIGMMIKLCAGVGVNMIPLRDFMYYCVGWELETVPYWKHILVITITMGILMVCGLFIPSINLAFGLVGSLCGGFIGFIFPALFWMYCGGWSLKTVGLWHFLATYFLLLSGVVAVVFGTAATIYGSFFS